MNPPSAPERIRLLVADDHPMLRDGIVATVSRQPDMEVVGEAADGVEAVALHRALCPDVTLIDVQMPSMGGIDAIGAIRRHAPHAALLVLTTYPGDAQAIQAMRAGASGYLLKSCIRRELLDAIRAVHAGRRAVSPEIAHDLATHALDERLTEREVSILSLVAEGHPNKQIAWRLDLSIETVKAHLKNIFAKLDVDDRTKAAMVATRRGYLGR